MQKILFILLHFITLNFFGQNIAPHDSLLLQRFHSHLIPNLEIPKTNSHETIIHHTAYSFSYNEKHEQANWVAYLLTKEETQKAFERSNKFLPDPEVKTQTANDADYKSSGYDRGHLAPAADMSWSEITMQESFYYSNMSPQVPSFNRGIWKKCEELVRSWANENDSIYIVTGPVLKEGLPTIGENKVSVPNYYYKVILDYCKPSIKGIGFIFPNTASSEDLEKYTVSIDSVEVYTGIDFYPSLPDEQEEFIEKTTCIDCWHWKKSKTATNSSNEQRNPNEAAQCIGTTKSGNRCKNKTTAKSGYCKTHAKQKPKKK
jgi:endonuclease G